ncbi:MAG TPA: cysteine synthase family protein [Gemmatimonadales bacterium]|nr:cysteine synthase family protein [Gemmatimonadales bacterium]
MKTAADRRTGGPAVGGASIEPTLWSLVGNTPLLPLDPPIRPSAGPPVFLKAEWFNPGGSVKDRPALFILRDGIARGELPGKRLLDATSGNTGIAYAMLGAAAGIGVTLCVPANASVERKALLEAYGAETIYTDPLEGTDGAIRHAQSLAAAQPDRYWYADQYNHPANPDAHARTTAEEIWRQTEGRVTRLVAGLGTTGTLMGAGRRLRELNPNIELVAVQPEGPFHGLEGLKHLATAIVPGIYNPSIPDRTEFIATEDAEAMVRRLAREAGLFVGWSAGAAVVAAERVTTAQGGSRRPATDLTVVIGPDSGLRYLSERERLEGTAP